MFAVLVAKTVADVFEPRSICTSTTELQSAFISDCFHHRRRADDLVIEYADLPYLDAKTEYIHATTPSEVLDSEVPYISLDTHNTVSSLRLKLVDLYQEGRASGFPIIAHEDQHSTSSSEVRMYGYIASKELEHGLALARARGLDDETVVKFRIAEELRSGRHGGLGLSGMVTPAANEVNNGTGDDDGEIDLSWLVDSAPIVVNIRSPMELLHEVSFPLFPFHSWSQMLTLSPHIYRCSQNLEYDTSS